MNSKKKKSPVCGCNASDVNNKMFLCEKKPLHGFEIDKYNREIDCLASACCVSRDTFPGTLVFSH